jgi:branched-chain amino acid transport system substrate-binding protein
LRTVAVGALLLLAGCPAPPPGSAGGPAPKDKAGTTPQHVGLGAAAGSQSQWGPDDGLVLGSYMSLTGGTATFGQSSNKAMGMAIEEINGTGGVLGGKRLKLVVEDSASKPEEAANAAQRLVTLKKAVVVVGEVASSCSLAAAPLLQKAGVPMLTPSSTNPRVTAMGDGVFRSCYTDDQQGAYVAKFALSKGYKTGVILKDTGADYSKGLTTVITERFTKGGGKILATEGYAQKQPDFNAILTKIKDLKPDVIFVPGYYEEVGLIIKQARALGIGSALMGGDGWDSPVLAQIAGAQLDERCFYVNHYSMDDPRPKVQAFVKGFKERYNGEAPDALAACAYDAIHIVAQAIERAKSAEPKAIKAALAQTKGFDGVTGEITIDAQRNASKSCVVLTFKAGKQVVAGTIKPSEL